jgi:hypothetical protein
MHASISTANNEGNDNDVINNNDFNDIVSISITVNGRVVVE